MREKQVAARLGYGPIGAEGKGNSKQERLEVVVAMAQRVQVFPLAGRRRDGTRWAYWCRVGGRGSRRVQKGGFVSEQAMAEALEPALEQLRREQGLVESPTLAGSWTSISPSMRASPRRRARWKQRCAQAQGAGGNSSSASSSKRWSRTSRLPGMVSSSIASDLLYRLSLTRASLPPRPRATNVRSSRTLGTLSAA